MKISSEIRGISALNDSDFPGGVPLKSVLKFGKVFSLKGFLNSGFSQLILQKFKRLH